MIVDVFENQNLYQKVNPAFSVAMAAAEKLITEKAAAGRYDFDMGVYAMVQAYESNVTDEPVFEAHKEYIDIQIVTSGKETVLVSDLTQCEITTPYTPDYLLCKAPVNAVQSLTLVPGVFAVFFPGDAHAPGLAFEGVSAPIQKIVVKVPV